jgi:chromosome segregation ATPase
MQKSKTSSYPKRAKDVPVTQRMLFEVRDELKALIKGESKRTDAKFARLNGKFSSIDARFADMDVKFANIDAKFADMDVKFANIDAKFADMDVKFANIDGKFANIDARFDTMESKFSELQSEVHRVALLVEEQNARNAIVMDGLTILFERQERVEQTLKLVTK